MAVGYDP